MVNIIGATGKSQKAPFLQSVTCCLGGQVVQHKFLYIPECPIPFLGRDLLTKLQAQISFQPMGEVMMTTGPAGEFSLEMPLRDHWCLMMVKEEEGILPVSLLHDVDPGLWVEDKNQYPIPRQAAEGVWVHLKRLLQHGILKQCQSQ